MDATDYCNYVHMSSCVLVSGHEGPHFTSATLLARAVALLREFGRYIGTENPHSIGGSHER